MILASAPGPIPGSVFTETTLSTEIVEDRAIFDSNVSGPIAAGAIVFVALIAFACIVSIFRSFR